MFLHLMANIKKIQKTIYLLNEACNRNKLTFPEDISGESEEEVNKNFFSHMIENDIKFKSSNDCLHPNLLSYWVKLKVCKIERKDTRSKSEIYLVNDKDQKINISKQIYFGYQFVEELKNSKDKKHIDKLFDEDGYIINLKQEVWVKSWFGSKNKTVRRLDFVFDVGNDKKIVVEYLEDHHINEIKNNSQYQALRLVDIYFGPDKNNLIHFSFVWDINNRTSTSYIRNKVKNFVKICGNNYNISNEESYIINLLNKEIKDKKFCKVLFDSYKNENIPILNINHLNDLFQIKTKKLQNRFIKEANELTKKIGQDEQTDDLWEENEVKPRKIYFVRNGKEILLSNHGLCLYLKLIRKSDCNIDYYEKSIHFVQQLGKSAYTSAFKIRDLINNMKENSISGLDDL